MPFYPENVRAEMARKRLTVEDVARLANLSPSTVHKATTEDGNPTKQTIEAIAVAVEVDAATFWKKPTKTA